MSIGSLKNKWIVTSVKWMSIIFFSLLLLYNKNYSRFCVKTFFKHDLVRHTQLTPPLYISKKNNLIFNRPVSIFVHI